VWLLSTVAGSIGPTYAGPLAAFFAAASFGGFLPSIGSNLGRLNRGNDKVRIRTAFESADFPAVSIANGRLARRAEV